MSEVKVTNDLILSTIKGWVESKASISAEMWMDAAMKLNILSLDDAEAMIDAELRDAQLKLGILAKQEKRNVAAAEIEVEASPEYRHLRILQERMEVLREAIRLAKKSAGFNEWK